MTIEGEAKSSNIEMLSQSYPYEAIVVLPYTGVERSVDSTQAKSNIDHDLPGPRTTHRMSHFTSRAILAGWELFDQKKAPKFILPGEGKDPSTADLEANFLINNRGLLPDQIQLFTNKNGTVDQLEPIAKLQRNKKLGKILVVSFEFHRGRVEDILKRFGIDADTAEVEQTHTDYLKARGNTNVDRDQLVNLPQVLEVKKAEEGLVKKIHKLDGYFGDKAPISRLLKHITGPTVTDIDHGRVVMTFPRAQKFKIKT